DIGGGEPFLRPDLPKICAAFDTKALSIPTNGFDPALIKEMAREVRKNVKAEVNISLSIDGFEAVNDEMRGGGSFRKALETLKALKSVDGIRIKVNTVVCDRNYNELIGFMQFIRKFDIDFHSIIFLRPAKNSVYPFTRPSYENLLRIKKDIFKIWDSYDYGLDNFKKSVLKEYQRRMYEASLQVIKEKRQIPNCLAGRFHLVIWANGDISFCETLKPFGNINHEEIGKLLKSDRAGSMRKCIRAKNCFCHHNCNLMDNFFLSPVKYPQLLSGIFK
ncbi:MAG TPA: radical SAM protein, partial [Candidatus Omnitrophota bacterium]|nr:radical SAM protein [Candidatus Omnitrophota bacterium]